MRIWFDLSNSPHINMFYDLIRDLEADGHEVIITSRPLANTVELLDQRGLKHTVVGEHYGKDFLKKIFGYPIRVMQLRKFLKKQKPDLAISQSSFHSPVVAKLLGIPSIYTNDNEHALGNKPAFYTATKILIPENLAIEKVARGGISAKKVIQYPGVKEGIYLWMKGEKIQAERKNNPAKEVNIYIRPEPQTAQYYKGKENFLDDTIVALQHKYKITVLPRDANQSNHYKQEKFKGTIVPDKPLGFDFIAANCSIFIGAGGSMTRELAILGIPTISVYQDELLDVDSFLLSKGLMLHEPLLTPEKVESYIKSLQNTPPSLELMEKGKAAYKLFKQEILKFEKK
ncbi:MAG: DUF354 domain-containing protein [Ferruginibacter sp.]